MKFMVIAVAFSMSMLVGCSYLQDSTRIPASEKDVGATDPDGDVQRGEPCGLQGSVEERIRDCSSQPTSEKEGFVLVTRTKKIKEVYQETKTGLLWSDRLPSTMNQATALKACHASLAEVAKISNVAWRLPTKEEYEEAETNGIRKALPNMNYTFWSKSFRTYHAFGYFFSGLDGDIWETYPENDELSVRCLAENK